MPTPWPTTLTAGAAPEPPGGDLDAEMPRGAAEGEIPAIDDPDFGPGRWLRAEDELLAVEADGDTRAYPIRVLDYHEIVNDRIGGRPVAVTFCPLCGSGVAWDRRVDGTTLSFIVSGRLYRNDLVMKDRETGGLWPQITGRCRHGELAGQRLDPVPCWRTTWRRLRATDREVRVLARPDVYPAVTYEDRSHPGYADRPDTLFEPEHEDPRLARKTPVFGVARGDDALAIRRSDLAEVGLSIETVDGEEVVLGQLRGRQLAWWTGDRDLAVDGEHLEGPDGERWDPLHGRKGSQRLAWAGGVSCFWFAWADFHPDARLWHE